MQIRILRTECCGNGECVELAPAVFRLDSKNRAVVLDPDAEPAARLFEVAEACPCQAIVVMNDDGDDVYP